MYKRLLIVVSTLLLSLSVGQSLSAQVSEVELLSSWVAIDAPTGHEHLAMELIEEEYPGWERDSYGNLAKLVGRGEPLRVVACGLDSYSYAVSQITREGYLRLHRIGNGSRHPLWDQAHEGQQLRVLTRSGPVVGVTAVANGHFAAQHRDETAIVTQNDLWLDVGAESADEVSAMGIALLDPVLRHIPQWSYADEIAGPRAGSRVGCAALVAAAEAGINGTTGSTKYLISVQQVFGWIGLAAGISRAPTPEQVIVLGAGQAEFGSRIVDGLGARADTVLTRSEMPEIRLITPAVTDADALMERLSLNRANQVLDAMVGAIDPAADRPAWVTAPEQAAVLNNERSRWGAAQNLNRLMEIEGLLDQVAERSAVPGHEGPIRNIILDAMPDWAREVAQFDAMGNMWVEFGPVGQATVFLAHMDEVGYEVESIDTDGMVNLTRLGGVVSTAWEGQPALLQLDPFSNIDSQAQASSLRGVFNTRSNPDIKQVATVTAWFGMDAEQLAAAGVRIGMGVTGYKEGHRMGSFRYTSRSLDDRVGTTSLLMALHQIAPEAITNRVIFAWTVREEGGLRGAAAIADAVGVRTRRAYSIDTFVSSDTPLESPHFAYIPLGSGPVLRSIESASMATPYEYDRNRGIAASAGIDAQVGLTQGGTDGTTFTVYGAPNAGLSWPGRYSHSPAEIADLRDVAKLIDLIQAMAEAPQGP
ncbi:MAG: M20/M25/M40 family metallo-hydrolase [Gammaproteobacteria bacterium]|nr:M20/M25/M40 family metallo-hydrolase [Gammaproteobacteria bacterium]MDG2336524.1 M20/M25/M40 family metallo-hydrolase [Gammaproteobacteria bacterium]